MALLLFLSCAYRIALIKDIVKSKKEKILEKEC
jgi:hypothetical protein